MVKFSGKQVCCFLLIIFLFVGQLFYGFYDEFFLSPTNHTELELVEEEPEDFLNEGKNSGNLSANNISLSIEKKLSEEEFHNEIEDDKEQFLDNAVPSLQELEEVSSSDFFTRAKTRGVNITEDTTWKKNGEFLVKYRRFNYPPFVIEFPKFVHKSDYEFFRQWHEVAPLWDEFQKCKKQNHPECLLYDYAGGFFDSVRYLHGSVIMVKTVSIGCSSETCGKYGCHTSKSCGKDSCGWMTSTEPPDSWWFTHTDSAMNQSSLFIDKGFYAEIPESWAFQHWIPDLLPKIVQAWDAISDPDIKILTVPPRVSRSPMVQYLWEHFEMNQKLQFLSNNINSFSFNELTVGCHAPAVHPFLWEEMQYRIGVQPFPKSDLTLLIYLGRLPGAAVNGGRFIDNEKELVELLQAVAQFAGLEFHFFDHRDYQNVNDTLKFFNQARIIIGPHGGALFNLIFVSRHASVIEIFPRELYGRVGGNIINWLQAGILGQDYWRIHAIAKDAAVNNIHVDLAELVEHVLSPILEEDLLFLLPTI